MEKKRTCLIWLLFITIDATVVTTLNLFTRVMRVAPQDRGLYTLGSHTGIPIRAMCAMHCKREEEGCLSFSYTEVNKTCDTYSLLLSEDNDADVSMETMYFSLKDYSNPIPVLVYSNCSDVPHESPSGVYKIVITEGNSLDLFCDMDYAEGPWTVIQRRINGDVDFYRNWTDYKNGFGDLHGNFWIGNDILHLLTNTSRILRFELEGWEGTKGYAQYSQFQVDNEDQNYTLIVQGFSGNVSENAMNYSNGTSFSTYDRDNDLYSWNCAETFHGAWWYRACTHSNLNGRYQPDNGDDFLAMWRWYFPDVSRQFAPLKKTMMMIR